mmetsp:Transcript_7442/g.12943  ORF Transcript_7442/g.12943 Transcript_7442/m.12943 type:complete len:580 (-) Transcript_7442:263-2002(-)
MSSFESGRVPLRSSSGDNIDILRSSSSTSSTTESGLKRLRQHTSKSEPSDIQVMKQAKFPRQRLLSEGSFQGSHEDTTASETESENDGVGWNEDREGEESDNETSEAISVPVSRLIDLWKLFGWSDASRSKVPKLDISQHETRLWIVRPKEWSTIVTRMVDACVYLSGFFFPAKQSALLREVADTLAREAPSFESVESGTRSAPDPGVREEDSHESGNKASSLGATMPYNFSAKDGGKLLKALVKIVRVGKPGSVEIRFARAFLAEYLPQHIADEINEREPLQTGTNSFKSAGYKELKRLRAGLQIRKTRVLALRCNNDVLRGMVDFLLSPRRVGALSWNTENIYVGGGEYVTIPNFVTRYQTKELYEEYDTLTNHDGLARSSFYKIVLSLAPGIDKKRESGCCNCFHLSEANRDVASAAVKLASELIVNDAILLSDGRHGKEEYHIKTLLDSRPIDSPSAPKPRQRRTRKKIEEDAALKQAANAAKEVKVKTKTTAQILYDAHRKRRRGKYAKLPERYTKILEELLHYDPNLKPSQAIYVLKERSKSREELPFDFPSDKSLRAKISNMKIKRKRDLTE